MTVRGKCVLQTGCGPQNPPPHQLGVQVDGTGEEQHSCFPVFSLQAPVASVVAVGARGTGREVALTLTSPRAYSWDCASGWEALGWRDQKSRQRFLELIQASSGLGFTEVDEPYYSVAFSGAQGGRGTGPKLHSMPITVQNRNQGPWDKVVTHYSLTLRGTVNPESVGLISSKLRNAWLVPKMRCMVSLGSGVTHGFGSGNS